MKLYKRTKDSKYLYWAVTCMAMQAAAEAEKGDSKKRCVPDKWLRTRPPPFLRRALLCSTQRSKAAAQLWIPPPCSRSPLRTVQRSEARGVPSSPKRRPQLALSGTRFVAPCSAMLLGLGQKMLQRALADPSNVRGEAVRLWVEMLLSQDLRDSALDVLSSPLVQASRVAPQNGGQRYTQHCTPRFGCKATAQLTS